MKKAEVVSILLGERQQHQPICSSAEAYAPSNIALCKYWGKRDETLNLPVTSSLSISLGDRGTTTTLSVTNSVDDTVVLNGQPVDPVSSFYKRLVEFLDLFSFHTHLRLHVDTRTNIPTAAGLASSASGFAALVLALNKLFDWKLSPRELSILARLGSGSASRSIWQGFVEWHAGIAADGMDSYAEPIEDKWPELCIGLLILSTKEKDLSSRDAMKCTVKTSPFYPLWPAKVKEDLAAIKQAINKHDFLLLGKTAEFNAMAMHATMLSSWPPISFALPSTSVAMHKVWQLRREGLELFFTQDAGPNLKLLFLEENRELVAHYFSEVEIIQPFRGGLTNEKI